MSPADAQARDMDQRIHAAVDRLLLEQGEYVPLDLLLDLGCLASARYLAWRRGQEAGYLKDALTRHPDPPPPSPRRSAGRRPGRSEAIALWCRLCWRAPEHVARLLGAPSFPDPKVKQAWHAWLDQDEDLDPSLEWFPGWLLLREPGLVHALAEDTAGDTPGPQRVFRILRELLRLEGVSAAVDLQLDLRRALQQTHPGLLQLYLHRRAGAV